MSNKLNRGKEIDRIIERAISEALKKNHNQLPHDVVDMIETVCVRIELYVVAAMKNHQESMSYAQKSQFVQAIVDPMQQMGVLFQRYHEEDKQKLMTGVHPFSWMDFRAVS
jgi:hypothetical protein